MPSSVFLDCDGCHITIRVKKTFSTGCYGDRDKSQTASHPLAKLTPGTYKIRVIYVGRDGKAEYPGPQLTCIIADDGKLTATAAAQPATAPTSGPATRPDAYSQNPVSLDLYDRLGYVRRGEVFFPGRDAPFVCFEKVLRQHD